MKYSVKFSIEADGSNLLWDTEDTAVIEAKSAIEAREVVKCHCRRWGYNEPLIEGVTAL